MIKEYTCINCPVGCEVEVTLYIDEIVSIEGANCKKGIEYVTQEIKSPMRTIQTSILVEGGELPITSVTTSIAIPKDMIFDIVREIKKIKVTAPVKSRQVVIENVLNTKANIIVTKQVNIK